jgi:hypothetical protein
MKNKNKGGLKLWEFVCMPDHLTARPLLRQINKNGFSFPFFPA